MIRFFHCIKCDTKIRVEGLAVKEESKIVCPICLSKTRTPHADKNQSDFDKLVDWSRALGEDDARMRVPMNFRVTSRPSFKPLTSDQWDFLESVYRDEYKKTFQSLNTYHTNEKV